MDRAGGWEKKGNCPCTDANCPRQVVLQCRVRSKYQEAHKLSERTRVVQRSSGLLKTSKALQTSGQCSHAHPARVNTWWYVVCSVSYYLPGESLGQSTKVLWTQISSGNLFSLFLLGHPIVKETSQCGFHPHGARTKVKSTIRDFR